MKIIQATNEQAARDTAGNALQEVLLQYKDKPVLLLLSGGSALQLTEYVSEKVLSEHMTIGMLDERFSSDPAVNNFLQFKKTALYEKATQAHCRCIESVPEDHETREELAIRIEKALLAWRDNHPDGVIVVTQGIGTDGHTAGIMPYDKDKDFFQKLFIDTEKWVVDYDAGEKNQYSERITATIPFLINQVAVSIVHAVGAEKREIIEDLKKEGSIATMPARVMTHMKQVHIFTDQ